MSRNILWEKGKQKKEKKKKKGKTGEKKQENYPFNGGRGTIKMAYSMKIEISTSVFPFFIFIIFFFRLERVSGCEFDLDTSIDLREKENHFTWNLH